jgi:nicotinate-nucleotide adenylyltransferase
MQVAFYGGSFNPPHVAHVLAATYLLTVGAFDRILVVPVCQHAFDKPLADFAPRVRMCELAMSFLPKVEVSSVEGKLEKPNWTVATLEYLKREQPNWRWRLVVGADQLADTDKWRGFDRLVALAPLYVLGRVGVSHPSAPPPVWPGISSTEVRRLLQQRGEPSVDAELERTVPRSVLDYIREQGLYQ